MKTRNADGGIVPLGSVMNIKETTGPDRVVRYNLYPAAEINGDTAKGFSSGQSLDTMERLAHENLPRGMSFEWTDLAFQQRAAGNTALFIFPLCVLFVFLTLAAQYESWTLPLAVILIVPMCLLSAIAGVMSARLRQQHPHPDRLRRAGRSRRARTPFSSSSSRASRSTRAKTASPPRSKPAVCACVRS